MINALSLLVMLGGVLMFVVGLHQWSERPDTERVPLVPWLDRDEEFWVDDEEYERED